MDLKYHITYQNELFGFGYQMQRKFMMMGILKGIFLSSKMKGFQIVIIIEIRS